MEDTFNQEEFEAKKKLVLDTLAEMAAMTSGGLYIKDIDCDGGIYSLNDIDVDGGGNVRLKAYMWEPTELSKKTGLFRD